jgi:hypothetical protein
MLQHQLHFCLPHELFDMLPVKYGYFEGGVMLLLHHVPTYYPPIATISTLLDLPWHAASSAMELIFDRSSYITVTASMLTRAVNKDNHSRHWRACPRDQASHYQKT